MSLREELSPITNWRGWLMTLALLFFMSLPGRLGDGPEEREAARRAAHEIMAEQAVTFPPGPRRGEPAIPSGRSGNPQSRRESIRR